MYSRTASTYECDWDWLATSLLALIQKTPLMVQKCSFLLQDLACPFIDLTCGALTASAAYATEIFLGFKRLLICAFIEYCTILRY